MKNVSMKREDRLRQIMLAFAVRIQSGQSPEMTLADIARACELSVSGKLRDMVVELIIEGALDQRVEPMPGIVGKRFIYYPTAVFDARRGKKVEQPRTIVFRAKKNGKQAMWKEVVS